MARPPKHLTKSGQPVRRIGEKKLAAVDEGGHPHRRIMLPEEARGRLNCSSHFLAELAASGVVGVVSASSGRGFRLYSGDDVEALAIQLGISAAVEPVTKG